MAANDSRKKAPPAPGSDPRDNRGYAEANPRDRDDARISRPKPGDDHPEAGGPRRGGEDGPGAADD